MFTLSKYIDSSIRLNGGNCERWSECRRRFHDRFVGGLLDMMSLKGTKANWTLLGDIANNFKGWHWYGLITSLFGANNCTWIFFIPIFYRSHPKYHLYVIYNSMDAISNHLPCHRCFIICINHSACAYVIISNSCSSGSLGFLAIEHPESQNRNKHSVISPLSAA